MNNLIFLIEKRRVLLETGKEFSNNNWMVFRLQCVSVLSHAFVHRSTPVTVLTLRVGTDS